MRVLVRTRKTDGLGPGNDTVEVVDAETGEQIRGIAAVTFHAEACGVGNKLTLEIIDYEIDIEEEATVVKRSG